MAQSPSVGVPLQTETSDGKGRSAALPLSLSAAPPGGLETGDGQDQLGKRFIRES
jgi:hypothetical protein